MNYYATLGESCKDAAVIAALLRAGISCFRLNLSHGSLREKAGWIDALHRAERETGLRLTGDEYKRKKEGETPETARFYNLRSLVCCRTLPIGPELFAPELADTVRETLLRLLPLYEYFSAL